MVGAAHTGRQPVIDRRCNSSRLLPVFPACRATVLALYDGRALVPEVGPGQRCGVILDQTCFYSEQGGQSHDRGFLTRGGLRVSRASWETSAESSCDSRCSIPQEVLFSVEAVNRAGGYVVHQVTVADHLRTGDQVELHLDQVPTEPEPECLYCHRTEVQPQEAPPLCWP